MKMAELLLFASSKRARQVTREVAAGLRRSLREIDAVEAKSFALGRADDAILVYELCHLSDPSEVRDIAAKARERVVFIYHETTSSAEQLVSLCREGGSWRICEINGSMLTNVVRVAIGADVRGRVTVSRIVERLLAGRTRHEEAVSMAVAATVVVGFGRLELDRTWKSVPMLAAAVGLSESTLRRRCRQMLRLSAVKLLRRTCAEWLILIVHSGATLRSAAAALRMRSDAGASRLVRDVYGLPVTKIVDRLRGGEESK
jgi:AraC-like DNA-binding protein